MKLINYRNSSFIIFIIIAILYAIGNFIWWLINTPIYPYGLYAQRLMDVFSDTFFSNEGPFVVWITKFMFYLFGKTYFDLQIMFINYIFFLTGIFFLYKLCYELENKMAGNIAMILLALVPAIYGLSRIFSNQIYHFTLMMIVNIYCLIKLDNFKNRKWTFIYGITVGIGLLIKDAFCVFFFTPWLYVVIRSLAEKTDLKKIINISVTILLGFLISYCHYFNKDTIVIRKMLHDPITETEAIFCFDSLKVLTIGLSEFTVSPLFFIIFLIAFYWFLFKYKNKNKLIIVFWFLVPWLIMMFMPHIKFRNYGVPFIPVIILTISIFLSSIKKVVVRKLVVYALLFVGVIQYVDFSYGILNISLFNKNVKLFNRYQIGYYDKEVFFGYDTEETKKNIMIINSLKEYKGYTILKPYLIKPAFLCIAALNDLKMEEEKFEFEDPNELLDIEKMQYKCVFLDLEKEKEKFDDKILYIARDLYWLHSGNTMKKSKEEHIEENIRYLLNFYNKLNGNMYVAKTIYISPDEIYKIYKSKD